MAISYLSMGTGVLLVLALAEERRIRHKQRSARRFTPTECVVIVLLWPLTFRLVNNVMFKPMDDDEDEDED